MNLTRNILTTLAARTFLLGVALASSMVLARFLAPEGRGLFALVLLLPELIKSFALLGFEQANVVFAGLEPDRRRALVWHSVALSLVIGALAALGAIWYVAAGAPGFPKLLAGPLWLYIVPLALVPVRLLVEYWSAVLRGMNRIVELNAIEVGTRVVSLALIAVCLIGFGSGVAVVVCIDAAVLAATVLALGAMLAAAGVLGRPTYDPALWGRTMRFALPGYGGTVMSYLNYRIDQFLIAFLLAPKQLAFYIIAVDIAERLWIIPGAVSTALLPHLANQRRRDPALTALVARHTALWTGAGCVAVFLISGVAVHILYGEEYAETVAPLRWLLPGILTLTVGKVLVAELLARKLIWFTSWLSLGAAVINTAASLLLIPSMGITGAAVASSLSYTAVGLFVVWYFLHVTKCPWQELLPRWEDVEEYRRRWRGRRRKAEPEPEPEMIVAAEGVS